MNDKNGEIYNTDIKNYKFGKTLLTHVKIITTILTYSGICWLAYELGIPGSDRLIHTIPLINELPKVYSDLITETENGRTSKLFNPHSNFILSSNPYKLNANNEKVSSPGPKVYIHVDTVRWAKNTEQQQMVGMSLFDGNTPEEREITQGFMITEKMSEDESSYLVDHTSLYRFIEYFKKEKGFDNVFIRMVSCRPDEFGTEEALELSKELGDIPEVDGIKPTERFARAYSNMQQIQLDNAVNANPYLKISGGATRRPRRTRTTPNRRMRRTVRKCRRSRRRRRY